MSLHSSFHSPVYKVVELFLLSSISPNRSLTFKNGDAKKFLGDLQESPCTSARFCHF